MNKLRVLIGCEFSGVVRRAFRDRGHEAFSCDLLPAEDNSPYHYKMDVLELLKREQFDMMVAHPPCCHLAVSGAQWFKEKRADGRQQAGIDFFMKFTALDSGPLKWCIENPIGIMSRIYRKPDQIVHPYHFGHETAKATCLWLNGLPALVPTNIVEPKWHVSKKTGKRHSQWDYDISRDHKNRKHLRSITFDGIAKAMEEQWGNL